MYVNYQKIVSVLSVFTGLVINQFQRVVRLVNLYPCLTRHFQSRVKVHNNEIRKFKSDQE